MARIVMLLDNSYPPDPRVENEINALLSAGHSIELFCVKSDKLEDFQENDQLTVRREIPVIFYRPFSEEYQNFVKDFAQRIAQTTPDFIHCHDFRMLFLGVEIKKLSPDSKLIYDSHEFLAGYPYFIRNSSLSSKMKGLFIWTSYIYREKKSFKYVDAVITVSENLRQRLEKSSGKPAFLIRNIPPNATICKENCNYWHEHFKLEKNCKVLIHTGNAHYSNKRIKWLLKAVSKYEDLALIFLGSNTSLIEIENKAKKRSFSNVYFHEQIPRKYITFYCSQANFGLVYTWNRFWKSYWYALPNKLIDVSLAGLPVLATNQPELKNFVDRFKNGITFSGNNERELNEALASMIKNEGALRENGKTVAEKISWEKESEVLCDIYSKSL